ncbi:hypothetical protein Agub_g10469 [Astrephomene gubernaculifera]|uniref:VOC domain-containing protein n=1 Tax=Astrephomene gubernaculifera TaxID=47775 RepID=A0AAD3DXI0_9CHLO|nr:hypothetical protein Agub_g10469 [Astrephomene gubernaculifera]
MLQRIKLVSRQPVRCSLRHISRPRLRVEALARAAMKPSPCRNLHWVFKVGDRTATTRFLQEVLLMEPLRHEEFTEGCAAACNGPYDGMWSKTMIGYGPEDDHFVLELTYNYGVKSYQLGNDYAGIAIASQRVYDNLVAKGLGTPVPAEGAATAGTAAATATAAPPLRVTSPDGYPFLVLPGGQEGREGQQQQQGGGCPVQELRLHVTDLETSLAFWSGFLGFSARREGPEERPEGDTAPAPAPAAVLSCAPGQCALRLVQLPAGQRLERGTAYGRVAFACPGEQLQPLEAAVRAAGYVVHTPYVSLDTPGKATVQVVILQDPDGHEICFVGEAGFRDLSRRDPEASRLLEEAVQRDDSAEWFRRRAEREARRDAERERGEVGKEEAEKVAAV